MDTNMDNNGIAPDFAEAFEAISASADYSPTACEITTAKKIHEAQRGETVQHLDADPNVARNIDSHLIHSSALNSAPVNDLSHSLTDPTAAQDAIIEAKVRSIIDHMVTTNLLAAPVHAAKLRNANRRMGELEQALGMMRTRVHLLESRVTSLTRMQEQMMAAAVGGSADGSSTAGEGPRAARGGGGGRYPRKTCKKRKGVSGEKVPVEVAGEGDAGRAAPGVKEELGEVEGMLAEVIKRISEFKISSSLGELERGEINEKQEITADAKENKEKGPARQGQVMP